MALAALVTACAVFAPLYDRTMLQSLVDTRLAATTPALAGVRLEAAAREQNRWDPSPVEPPPAPAQLLDDLPAWARASYDAPVLGWTDTVRVEPGPRSGAAAGLAGQLLWRTDACAHVLLTAGRCPGAAGETLVSTADLAGLGLRLGQRLTVADPHDDGTPPGATRTLTLVGSYRERPGDSWFDVPLTGASGTFSEEVPPHRQHDTWLTSEETFTTGEPLTLARSYAGLRLRTADVGVDEVLRLGTLLRRLDSRLADASAESGPRVRLTTGLITLAEQVRTQQRDSRVIVPLLMAQLGLLALVVLMLALTAVTDLRRPQAAVARLRGGGVRGARRLLLAELVPAVCLGVPPGVAIAWLGDAAAAAVLPGSPGVEARIPFWVALALVVAVLLGTTVLAAGRVARVPLDALLRRSSTVRRGWRVGVLDAVLVSACGAVVVAFLTGGLEGPVALLAPALLALLVGLVLAHVLTPAAAALGGVLLRRGRPHGGVGLLEAARGPALRSTVTVVTVAVALAVFSFDAVDVAARNRQAAAEQEAGAPLVATVGSRDVDAVRRATAGVPGATTVVRLKAPAAEAVTTLAVEPASFRRIALLPPGEDTPTRWKALTAGDVAPVPVTGTRLSVRVGAGGLRSTADDGSATTVSLGADVADDHHVVHTELGALPRSGTVTLATDVGCAGGCRLTALSLSTVAGSTMTGAVDVESLAVDGTPVPLGDSWLPFRQPGGGSVTPELSGSGLRLDVDTDGEPSVSVSQGWVPAAVPALLTRAAPGGSTLTGIDGRTRAGRIAGRLARVPGAPAATAVVDLDLLARGATVAADARVEVWARDAGSLAAVTRTLSRDGIGVDETVTLAGVRRAYDESTAAWSAGLGVAVGLAALAVALLLLAVLGVSGWRARARDLAALRLGGLPRRSVRRLAWTAQLPAVLVGALAGTACGLVGATVSMPIVPLFADAPGVSTLDLRTAWPPVVAVALVALVALSAWSALLGWSVQRRAGLDRLREGA